MKRMTAPSALLLMFPVVLPCLTVSSTPEAAPTLRFEPNLGQWDERALFRCGLPGATCWFTSEGVIYELTREIRIAPAESPGRDDPASEGGPVEHEALVFTAFLQGVSPGAWVEGVGRLSGSSSYLIGNDRERWRTGVPGFSTIVMRDVYRGTDLLMRGSGSGLEYEFHLGPGADPSDIVIGYGGIDSLWLADGGGIIVSTAWGILEEGAPAAFQERGGSRVVIACSYRMLGDASFGFELGEYDRRLPLVIDPLVGLVYSTYLGGSGFEEAHGLSVDASGSVLVAGSTYSTDFPTQAPYQGSIAGSSDAFVSRLAAGGGSLVFSTYLGGAGDDKAQSAATGADGSVYVTGNTGSSDFPTMNPFQAGLAGAQDAFVVKLSQDGSQLVYGTYIGGGGTDVPYSIAVDGSGYAFITGITGSPSFPTQGPFQTDQPGWDAFVTKLSQSGGQLVYSTYLGGSGEEQGHGIGVDAAGGAYVAGFTLSPDFPVQSAFQASFGGVCDAFVTRFTPSGGQLVYSTFLGGGSWDAARGLAVDAAGSARVSGETESADFPVQGALQPSYGGGASDAFAACLPAAGGQLTFSTFFGGSSEDAATCVSLGPGGTVFVSGRTSSQDLPLWNPFQGAYGGGAYDAFVAELTAGGNQLVYGTFLGGSSWDEGDCIDAAADGSAFVSGISSSTDFPLLAPLQGANAGMDDAFVAGFTPAGTGMEPSPGGAAGAFLRASPNPFTAVVTISIEMPGIAPASIAIFDQAGRRVADLWNGALPGGVSCLDWDAGGMPAGLYLVRAGSASGEVACRKLLLLD